jgi:hypothetical protein
MIWKSLEPAGDHGCLCHSCRYYHYYCTVEETVPRAHQCQKVMFIFVTAGNIIDKEDRTRALLQRLLLSIVTRGLLIPINAIVLLVVCEAHPHSLNW